VTVTEVSDKERARMRVATKAVGDKYTAEIGPDLVKEVNAELAKLRK
jgi:TRAP-type C4-dicarboxylate transport system substrate-binding protein